MEQDDLGDLRQMLDQGYDLAKLDADGESPLHWAAGLQWRENAGDVVRLLLTHGAPVDMRDKSGRTPLIVAAQAFNPQVTQTLVDAHADCELADKYGYKAIHYCVLWREFDFIVLGREGRCIQTMRALIKGGESVDDPSSDGTTPLMIASWNGHLASAKALIELGANVNAENRHNLHALSVPVISEQGGKCASLLIKSGAKPSFLEYTALGNTRKALETMPKRNVDRPREIDDRTALMIAAERGDVAVTRQLLERGANVQVRDSHQRTALHYAAGCEPVQDQIGMHWTKKLRPQSAAKIADLLIDKGADLDSLNEDRETPLYWAAAAGSWNLASELIGKGASAALKEPYRTTPLMLAVESNQTACVLGMLKTLPSKSDESALDAAVSHFPRSKRILVALVKAGFSLNTPYHEEGSPLTTASGKSQATVQALLALGADVNMPDRNGHTPIMSAKNWKLFQFLVSKGANPLAVAPDNYSCLFSKDAKIVRYMLDQKADPNRKLTGNRQQGRNPLIIAAFDDDFEIARLLLSHGADPEITDADGNSAMKYALESRIPKLVELFKNYKKKAAK